METIKDLRVLKAIINKSKLTTNNSNLIIDKQHKYLTDGYVITPIKYKEKKYVSRYMDGCFYPFIVELS